MTTGFDVSKVWIWSVTLLVSCTLLLFVSPRVEFSTNVLEVVVDDADDEVEVVVGGDVVICGIGFFNGKLNENGLFSLIKLRGNCIVESSLISVEDVDEASTTFVNVELLVITIDGIDADDKSWFEEFWWDDNGSREDEESDNGRGGGGANEWESTETLVDCVSKHMKTWRMSMLMWDS